MNFHARFDIKPIRKKMRESPMMTPSLTLMPPPFAWINIPMGKVTLESGGYLNERTTFDVPAFQIAKYPTTNAQFDVFINHPDGYKNPSWWDFSEDAKQWRAKNIQPLDKFLLEMIIHDIM